MAQQLVFTSAPAGLAPGSSGYCTVARSEAMREAVAAQLERWSVYAHAARGPRPVICAHRVWTLRGSTFHVLSRIVDSSLDHTGRTNFLAHHLVVQPHELHGAPSPAAVFQHWDKWLDRWTGAPRAMEDVLLATIPAGGNPLPARTWQEAAGDAGAAALLVNDAGTAARSVGLVVKPGQEGNRDLLPRLFAESLRLLDPDGTNPAAAWFVPFTTHLQAENDPGEFRWFGGWSETRARERDGAEMIVDFVTGINFPKPMSGALTELARNGRHRHIELISSVASEDSSSTSELILARRIAPRSPASPYSYQSEAPKTSSQRGLRSWKLICGGASIALALATVVCVFGWKQFHQHDRTEIPNDVQSSPTPQIVTETVKDPPPNVVTSSNNTPLVSIEQPRATPSEQPDSPRRNGNVSPSTPPLESNPALAFLPPPDRVYVSFVGKVPAEFQLLNDNPLADIIQSKLEDSYDVTLRSASLDYRKPGQSGKLIRSTDQDKLVLREDPSCTIGKKADPNKGESFSIVVKWNLSDHPFVLLSFTPKFLPIGQQTLRPFHLLMIADAAQFNKAAVKVSREMLSREGEKLVVRSGDELRKRFTQWLDERGWAMKIGVYCQSPQFSSPAVSELPIEIDFEQQRSLLVNYNAKQVHPVASPSLPAPSVDATLLSSMQTVKVGKVFAIGKFSGSNGVLDSVDPALPEPLNGNTFYKRLRQQLIVSFCKGRNNSLGDVEKAIAENILPENPADRFEALLVVPRQIESQKKNPANRIPDFKKKADNFITIWNEVFGKQTLEEHKEFLRSNTISLPTPSPAAVQPAPTPKLYSNEQINALVPDISRYSRIWIGTQINNQPLVLIEFSEP